MQCSAPHRTAPYRTALHIYSPARIPYPSHPPHPRPPTHSLTLRGGVYRCILYRKQSLFCRRTAARFTAASAPCLSARKMESVPAVGPSAIFSCTWDHRCTGRASGSWCTASTSTRRHGRNIPWATSTVQRPSRVQVKRGGTPTKGASARAAQKFCTAQRHLTASQRAKAAAEQGQPGVPDLSPLRTMPMPGMAFGQPFGSPIPMVLPCFMPPQGFMPLPPGFAPPPPQHPTPAPPPHKAPDSDFGDYDYAAAAAEWQAASGGDDDSSAAALAPAAAPAPAPATAPAPEATATPKAPAATMEAPAVMLESDMSAAELVPEATEETRPTLPHPRRPRPVVCPWLWASVQLLALQALPTRRRAPIEGPTHVCGDGGSVQEL